MGNLLRLFNTEGDNRYQDATRAALPPVNDQATASSISVTFTASALTQNVSTKLGRKFQGYNVTSNPANLTITNGTSPNPALFVTLTASGPGTISISVF